MTEPHTDQFVPDEDRAVELTEDEVILPDDAPVDDEDRHVQPIDPDIDGPADRDAPARPEDQ
ncbi:hypothetical protein CGZ96_17800 [Enemella evansiae]|uniref:hypothetical protein n=1 Tax=Enemella evansiae TaxID=2016499 RepID=UPI000B9683FC|nr:hypothetical protein [Enemella evansiae]OYN94717.1 hypothetical protein CGZ96_17800 [Enemella evansiae]